MIVDGVIFVREYMFLCADKESFVRFVDIGRVVIRVVEFINNIGFI